MANTEYLKGYDPRRDGGFWGWFSKWFFVGFVAMIAFCVWLVFLADAKHKRDEAKLEQERSAQFEAEQKAEIERVIRVERAYDQAQAQKTSPKAKKVASRHP